MKYNELYGWTASCRSNGFLETDVCFFTDVYGSSNYKRLFFVCNNEISGYIFKIEEWRVPKSVKLLNIVVSHYNDSFSAY